MSWKSLRDFTRTVSFRLNLWHAGIFLASAAVLFTLIYFLLGEAIDRKDRDMIEARLREYRAVYEHGGISALRDWTTRVNEAREQRMFFVRMVAPDGTVPLLVRPEDWFERDLALLGASGAVPADDWIRVPRDAEADLTVASTVLDGGTTLQVGRSSDSRATLLAKFRQVFIVVIPPVLLLGFVGGALVTSRMTRPIRNIVGAVSAILNTGRMDVRVPERSAQDELQDMVVLFNRMLDHNEQLIRALRDSLDNVAHDLRTPLSRLRATLESAVGGKSDLAAAQESVVDALEETESVQTIIRTLMDVAHAESGLMALQVAETDLRALVADVVDLYGGVAEEKNITIASELTEPLTAKVDAARVRQVFANLLDNAVKYTPPDGSVTISGRRQAGHVEIALRDNGPGIPADDLPHIWERLYRGDKSRSQHGLGLGLSLVKAIVEAHHGRVLVTSVEGEGAEFRVQFPA